MSKQIVCFLLCLAIRGGLAQEQEKSPDQPSVYGCRVNNLPTSWAFGNPPGKIEQNDVVFSELGQTAVDFNFRNLEPAPIQAVMLVLEYVDRQDHVIDQIPVSAAVGDEFTDSHSNVLTPMQTWKDAVSPGASALMGGVRQGIRTGSCPVRARVTFARVQFTDGTVRTFSFPGWRVGPVPRFVPSLSETVPALPVDPPVSLLARVKISATGQVADVVSEDQEHPKVLAWIKDRMKDWSFHPALLNGEPTDSELTVLFLIHAKGAVQFNEVEPSLAPVTLIQFFWTRDLFPGNGGVDRWTVMYGFLQEGSKLE